MKTEQSYTCRLAEFFDQLTFDDLSEEVVAKAKGTLIDYLGAALAGSIRPHAKKALEVIASLHSGGKSTVIGCRRKTSIDKAAFLNGLFGSSTPQFDDAFKESIGHPGVGTHPAVLMVGEQERVNGKDMLVAIVAGYEAAMRIGAAVGRGAFKRGWHPRGGCNVFASATASAKLLGLSGTEKYCAVLGLAGNKAAGLTSATYFYDAWYTLSGNASEDGVMAAMLARAGYDAGCTVLENEYGGYCRVVCERPNWERLMEGLGERFEIMRISQKPYPSTGMTHAAIEATLAIINQHHIRVDDVEKIKAWGFREMVTTMGKPYPQNILHATMSVPYLMAVAITDRQVSLPQLQEKRLRDPNVSSLQGKVGLMLDQEMDKVCPEYHPARVEIKVRDGSTYTQEVQVPKGDPRRPFTNDELQDKFRNLALSVFDTGRISEIIELVDNLEDLNDAGKLTSLLQRV